MTQQTTTAPNPSVDQLMGFGESLPTLQVGPPPKEGQLEKSPAGALLGGRITALDTFQVMKTSNNGEKEPRLTKKGDPIYGILITVDVAAQGEQLIWADGMTLPDMPYVSKRAAVIAAVRKAGAKTLELGGELYVGWTHKVDTGAPSLAVSWAAEYRPPSAAAVAALLAPQVAAPQVAQAAPVTPHVAAPVAPRVASPTAPVAVHVATPAQSEEVPF